MGCEAELRWPCRNESVAFLAGSFPLSSHTYRPMTMQVSREACCKASVPARGTLLLSIPTWFFLVKIHCVWDPELFIISGKIFKFKPVSPFPISTTVTSTHGTYGRIPSLTASLILSLGNWHNWERRIRPQILQVSLISLQITDIVFPPAGLFREYRATILKI